MFKCLKGACSSFFNFFHNIFSDQSTHPTNGLSTISTISTISTSTSTSTSTCYHAPPNTPVTIATDDLFMEDILETPDTGVITDAHDPYHSWLSLGELDNNQITGGLPTPLPITEEI